MDKHATLLRKSINYGRDKIYCTGPRGVIYAPREYLWYRRHSLQSSYDDHDGTMYILSWTVCPCDTFPV